MATWRQYHICTIGELNSGVLSRLYDKLKEIAEKRGWSLLPPQWHWRYEYYNFRTSFIEDKSDLSRFTSAENHTPFAKINCVNNCYYPFRKLSEETKLLFHFKHPATSTCNRISDCGFILKTVPSESLLWRVKLCTEEEDYRDETIHFHEEVRVDKIHLCYTYDNCKTLVPLSWLDWILSDEQREMWRMNYKLHGYRGRFAVLYDTTV